MAIEVKGYTKHVNGRLVTVRGYEQAEGGRKRAVRQIPQGKAHHTAAESGTHPHLTGSAKYTHGLSPHALFPANRSHVKPIIVWNRHGVQLSADYVALSSNNNVWTDAVREAIDHILLVVKNNPKKYMWQILQRPDVQQALQAAGIEGAQAVIDTLNSEWSSAGAPQDSAYLARVVADMTRNGASFANRMTRVLSESKQSQVERELLKDRLRASSAIAVVKTRAKAEAMLDELRKTGVTHIKWQARTIPDTDEFEENVCSSCRKLHGNVVPIGSAFDTNVLTSNGLRVYGDLIVPPAHPNCQCKIVAATQ